MSIYQQTFTAIETREKVMNRNMFKVNIKDTRKTSLMSF